MMTIQSVIVSINSFYNKLDMTAMLSLLSSSSLLQMHLEESEHSILSDINDWHASLMNDAEDISFASGFASLYSSTVQYSVLTAGNKYYIVVNHILLVTASSYGYQSRIKLIPIISLKGGKIAISFLLHCFNSITYTD